jgi:signal transduction histidine kinase
LATQEYTTIDAVREMVYPDDIEKFDALCEMYKQGSREAADVKILQFRMDFSKDGIYQWWESRSILENDDERRLKGSIYGILISIQEQKNIERQLSDALAKAQESERLKSAFLANISHELRTPLNAIVGFSDLITNADDKESRAEYSEIISYNNKLLVRLIENVLTMANLEAGTIRLHITEFDLSRLLEDAYKTMQLRVMQLRVELKKSIPEGEYLITSDRERLVQIVMNYLTNAIKYTEKGNITLGYVKRDSGVELYVTDTGIGIPEDKKDKVFSRFSKLDEFAPGNGLGLSISKALSEKLGGEVGFDSEYGKGSKFWVWVPESYNGEIEE